MDVPLGVGAYKRNTAGTPEVRMLNRFVEVDPTNLINKRALLARPGSTILNSFGDGPIRGMFSKPGVFDGALFVCSGSGLYRYDTDGTKTTISGEILGSGPPSFDAVSGAGYQHLFIADGLLLQVYQGGSHAMGTLTLTPSSPPDIGAEVIEIGGTYFGWSASVNSGSPAGTVGAPFLALIGANDAESLANMAKLLNFSGVRGTTYSSTVGGPNALVTAEATSTTLVVTARSEFAAGNAITTTVGAGQLAWGAGMLAGGGTHALNGVETPDGVGIVSLAEIASHIIAVHANSQRFSWIEPGDLTIDALNFAEAESEPDRILKAQKIGDVVWFVGQSSTEVWYATGLTLPTGAAFAPVKGRAYARGVVDGTAVKVKDGVMLVGDDGMVYNATGSVEPVSNNAIAERIRVQIRREMGL